MNILVILVIAMQVAILVAKLVAKLVASCNSSVLLEGSRRDHSTAE